MKKLNQYKHGGRGEGYQGESICTGTDSGCPWWADPIDFDKNLICRLNGQCSNQTPMKSNTEKDKGKLESLVKKAWRVKDV